MQGRQYDEKKQPLLGQTPHQRRSISSYLLGLTCWIAAFYFFLQSVKRNANDKQPQLEKLIPTQSWEEIKAPYRCDHLYAPLDHLNVTDKRTAKLAVVIYPAGEGRIEKDKVKGTILVNPGGPGGSGVAFLAIPRPSFNYTGTGEAMDKIMKGRFNILSWDLRGIGHSTPLANCFTLPGQSKSSKQGSGFYHSSSSALAFDLQHGRLLYQLCADHETLSDELRFVTTPSTARDMRLLYKAVGDKGLHFWGFNYGTVLGSIFADMFPDEVERLVLDGTVDLPNYLTIELENGLLDTQKTYEIGLLGECIKAKETCALNEVANGVDLKIFMQDILNELIREPMISTETNITFLDYTSFKMAIFKALYSPLTWPSFTKAVAEVSRGNATSFIKQCVEPAKVENDYPHAGLAIAGGDILFPRTKAFTLEDFKRQIQYQEMLSPLAGEVLASLLSTEESWTIIGRDRHFGNFTSYTRNPLLFIGNDYDPITPLLYARKMATLFSNASVLRAKMYGHASVAQPSQCTMDTIRDHFLYEIIPKRSIGMDGFVEPGKICDVDRGSFDEATNQQDYSGAIIMDALSAIIKR